MLRATTTRTTAVATAIAAAAAMTLAGCGGSTGGGAPTAFRTTAPGASKGCLVHQAVEPSMQYTGRAGAQTRTVLAFLGYLTKHGDEPFCNGRSASAVDRHWGELYVRLTGNSAKVHTMLRG